MKIPPASLVALVRLLRRDGPLFFVKCFRYAFSRNAWIWLLRGGPNTSNSAARINDLSTSIVLEDSSPEEKARSRRILADYRPRISVVVTSYNYAHVIRETLDALVAQTYPAHEILVVDNGSKDNSVSIIREYAAKWPSVRLLQHEGCVNKGLPGSVKLGSETATGEFVAFCESDDVWRTDHLEKKVELLREHWGEPSFIINDIEPFGETARVREILPMMETRRPAFTGVRNRISPEDFRKRNWIFTFSMCMIRRETLLRCDISSVPRPSNLDWWLWRQIALENDIWCVHEPLTKWRLHQSSYTCRDNNARTTEDGYDLISSMDRLLVRRHPIQAEKIRPFLRPEDEFCCEDGMLCRNGGRVGNPSFSIIVPVFGSRDALERTLDSLTAQTYKTFEVLLAGREEDALLLAAQNRLRSALGQETAVRLAPCPYTDLSALIDVAVSIANNEWGMLVVPGDILRPKALQTFAARIVLDPDSDGFWATARCMESSLKFGPLPGAKPFPFAAPGAFVFKFSIPEPADAPRFADYPEMRLLMRTVSGRNALFVDHTVVFHDDGSDGFDPFGLRLFAAAKAFAAWHGDPPPPTMPENVLSSDALVMRSRFFDSPLYLRENPDVNHAGIEPHTHYVRYGRTPDRNPSPLFTGDEYLAVNPDVGFAMVHSLVHYERHGRREGRLLSFLENDEKTIFPAEATAGRCDFSIRPPRHRRTAIFAAYSSDGRISEANLIYLKGLRAVADNVVFVCSNPLCPGEPERLESLVTMVLFEEHFDYDFGSYKRGWIAAQDSGLLSADAVDEVIFANDSCYGPVFPFEETFSTMDNRPVDFWGLASCPVLGRDHIQSFFFVFRRAVIDGPELDAFLRAVTQQPTRGYVVMRYEFKLTVLLSDAGYRFDTLVPADFREKAGSVPSRMPVTTMSEYRFPLLKAKSVNGDADESVDHALAIVRENNPELAAAIRRGSMLRKHRFVSLQEHRDAFQEKVRRISEKAASGAPVVTLFLVSHPSMFPGRPLFDAMRQDARFSPKLFVIPDLRGLENDVEKARSACRAELEKTIPTEFFVDAQPDEFGLWPDVIGNVGADIVCYPSPYDLSCFRFNPHWALGRDFLPIHVNYGFYRSIYDREIMRRQNYAYFWKAFFECEATAKEYADNSVLEGANADVVGYIKMDALQTAESWPRNGDRKRVLLAPHHSVEGGANNTLALSNFQRYADYFLSLPEKHPELDFVFRPHPFLFTILSNPSKWGPQKTADWISKMKAHPNVQWSDEGDYFPVFASCDACIQDCGSYLVEWFYTGKPCCYMLKDTSDIDEKFSPLGKDCLSHCHIAYDETEIERFLREVVEEGKDSKAAGREAFRKSIMVNYPHAAAAALQNIKASLELN